MPLLYLRAIGLPIVLMAGIIALVYARGRAATPQRGFLLAFWGSAAWLTLCSATSAALVWADESRAQIAGDVGLDRAIAASAIITLALALALGWRVHFEGERLLVALVRPPAGMVKRWIGGGAVLAMLVVLLLWLALTLGAFAAIYGALTHVTLSG